MKKTERKPIKIMIAVPCLDTLDVEFVKCLEALNRPCGCAVVFSAGSLVYVSRENLSKTAVENGFDYVLWLDSDMVFPPDLLLDLLDTATKEDADITAGLFFRRRPPYTPAMWKKIRMGTTMDERETIEYNDYPENSVFEIDACGMAATLVKTSAIAKCFEKQGTCFMPIISYGEDVSFCLRVKSNGGKIVCDSRYEVGHLGRSIITSAAFKDYAEAHKNDARSEKTSST